MKNARFWTYINGSPVKLTLRPWQRLHWSSGGPCEEGWSVEFERWEHAGDMVRRDSGTDGADCDGRLSTHDECECALDRLANGSEFDGVNYADWQRVSSGQRDYAAEAAGY